MEKSQERGSEPKEGMESSPKLSGYGTDKIGGKGGQTCFTRAVGELEDQGREHHHAVSTTSDTRESVGGMTNSKHPEHREGHKREHYEHRGRR
jgi:hypothetical protein